MQERSPIAVRLLLVFFSSAVALGVGWLVLSRLGPDPPPTVTEVDHSEAFADALEERRRGGEQSLRFLMSSADRDRFAEFYKNVVPDNLLWDPIMYMRGRPDLRRVRPHADHPDGEWVFRTNAQGMRNDRDVSAEPPGLRILVTGDSHTAGVCSNTESYCGLLEAALAADTPGGVEVLNTGVGAYNPYHYLGVIERWTEELRPDVCVVAVYGGNDFSGAIKFQRFFSRRGAYAEGPHVRTPLDRAGIAGEGILSQEVSQVLYFLNNPDDVALAADMMVAICDRIAELCAAVEAGVLFVYIPPATYGQPERYAGFVPKLLAALEIEEEDLAVSETITDAWLERMKGHEVVDMRPVFRAAEGPVYWKSDRHIDLAGQRLVAEALERRIRALLDD